MPAPVRNGRADVDLVPERGRAVEPRLLTPATARRRHRYAVWIRPEIVGFEALVVDHGGDGGGWQEAHEVTFGEAFATALAVVRDPDHAAFGAPIKFEHV